MPDKILVDVGSTITLQWLSLPKLPIGEREVIASLKIDIEDFSSAKFKDCRSGTVKDVTDIEFLY